MDKREGDAKVTERRMHERVSKLEDAWQTHYAEHSQMMTLVVNSAKGVEEAGKKVADAMRDLAEVVKLYNNGRGAFELTRSAGKFILWVASIIVGLSAIGAAIRYWWTT